MYHITNQYWGKTKKIYPRKLPDHPISGISVAPSLKQCVWAVAPDVLQKTIYVYRAIPRYESFAARYIYDYFLTKERIITSIVQFELVEKISDKNWLRYAHHFSSVVSETTHIPNRKVVWQSLFDGFVDY